MLEKFEDSLAELEQIVSQLEAGNIQLYKALELFEKGVSIARECQKQLDSADQRVEMLLRDSEGGYAEIPYSPDKD